MAFDPKIVFGLCNVLNRHAKHIHLKISLNDSSQYEIEQWAKRIDLTFRDNLAKWHLILNEPAIIVENLSSIEKLSSELISKLYDIEPGIEKQISKGLKKGGFVKFRTVLREHFESLKGPINDVKCLLKNGCSIVMSPEPIAAIESVIDVWKSSPKNKRLPKKLKSNTRLKGFIIDSFGVFEIDYDPDKAYETWYGLNHE